jgi:hypothetical protein
LDLHRLELLGNDWKINELFAVSKQLTDIWLNGR